MEKINIAGLNKEDVLCALFNASFQQGMGRIHAEGRANITPQEAAAIIAADKAEFARNGWGDNALNYDYLRGRVMKVDISGDEFCPRLYDRDVGQGAAANVIEALRAEYPL